MIPIWSAALPLVAFGTAGYAFDRTLRLNLSPLGHRSAPFLILTGLTAAYICTLQPILFAGLVALLAGTRTRRAIVPPAPQPQPSSALDLLWPRLAVLAGLAGLALKPRLPMHWDEYVWLAKARIESHQLGALRAAALTADGRVIPAGYPLFFPLAASWLSMASVDVARLVAGGTVFVALSAWALGVAVANCRALRPRAARVSVCVALASAPLVVSHARSTYVDLPVGLLAAALLVVLIDGASRAEAAPLPAHEPVGGDGSRASVLAIALAGLKDEGVAHVAAIVLAVLVFSARPRTFRGLSAPLSALLACAGTFALFRNLATGRGVLDTDHALTSDGARDALSIAAEWVRHAGDVTTWGALWCATIASAIVVLRLGKRAPPAARITCAALAMQSAALVGGVVFGPPRVHAFAASGTLINRLLAQLAPCAALLIALVVARKSNGESGTRGTAPTDSRTAGQTR